MHSDRVVPQPGNDPTPALPGSQDLRIAEIVEEARRTGVFTVQREVRVIREEQVRFRGHGLLLVGELNDALLVLPAQELTSELNSQRFRQDLLGLLNQFGPKPYIVIELNQQGNLPTDLLMPPLGDLYRACAGKCKLVVATRNNELRRKFSEMKVDLIWGIVDSGADAIRYIDVERNMAQRAAERGAREI